MRAQAGRFPSRARTSWRARGTTWITEKNKEFEDESSYEMLDLEEDMSKSELI
jgi:hypothetical protein